VAQATPGGARWQDDDCGQQAKSCVIEAWEAIPKKNLIILQIYLQIKKQVLHLYHCNGAAQVQNITKQKNDSSTNHHRTSS